MKQKAKDFILKLVLCICAVGILTFGILIYAQYQNPSKKDIDKTIEKVVSKDQDGLIINWEELKGINEDVVGWIYIPDTNINYPIVQGKNNNLYLHSTIYKNYSEFGSIFLDATNNAAFTDDNSIIYGHSIEYVGGMFTDLKLFAQEDFFKDHPVFYLLTPEQNYQCDVFIFAETDGGSIYYYQSFGDDFDEIIQQMLTEAKFTGVTTVNTEDKLITLSTCNLSYGMQSDQRFILVGVPHIYNETIKTGDQN